MPIYCSLCQRGEIIETGIKKILKKELHGLRGIRLKTGLALQALAHGPDTRAVTGSLPPNGTVAWDLQGTFGLVCWVLGSQLASQGTGRRKVQEAQGNNRILGQGRQEKKEAQCSLVEEAQRVPIKDCTATTLHIY